MSRWARWRPIPRVLLIYLFALEIGISGYLIGSSSAADESYANAVRRQAFEISFKEASTAAAARAKVRGRKAGRRAGDAADVLLLGGEKADDNVWKNGVPGELGKLHAERVAVWTMDDVPQCTVGGVHA